MNEVELLKNQLAWKGIVLEFGDKVINSQKKTIKRQNKQIIFLAFVGITGWYAWSRAVTKAKKAEDKLKERKIDDEFLS